VKAKRTFLGIAIAAVVIAALLPAGLTLAAPAPDPDAGQSKTLVPHASGGENPQSTIDEIWTSGWVDIAAGSSLQLTHNMGGDIMDYAIQLWFRDTDAGGYGVNNRGYGGDEDNGVWLGAFWRSLDNTTITVARQPADTAADQVRVWIWPSQADLEYCTNWAAIAPNTTVTVNHNLGGNVDDYAVKLWFRAASLNGVHQIYYGNAEGDNGKGYGAYWHSLDTAQVQVSRLADDTEVDEFYLCVSVPEPPDWDSGWRNIAPGETITLPHGLGGSINRYVVRMEFKAVPEKGSPQAPMAIHHHAYGGTPSDILAEDAAYMGANWQNLTNQSISVYRWAGDPLADQVRVRIWQRRMSVYLPVVVKNYP